MTNVIKDETTNWIYNGNIFTSDGIGDYYGFVYIITNNISGRRYIGKKFFYSIKKISGKRKKVTSDWEKYYGSNDELKQDVKELGAHNFTREILRLCASKSECGYYEARWQFETDCLLHDGWYNKWIMCRITKTHTGSFGS